MTLPLAVLWIAAGFVSIFAGFPWWWIPDPPPDERMADEGGWRERVKPQPQPWGPLALGALGGLLGGWAYRVTWVAGERLSGPEVASTVLGAVLGAAVLVSVYRLTTRRVARPAS